MASANTVRVLEQFNVSPPPGSVTQLTPLPLTLFDVLFFNISLTQRVFLYQFPHPTAHFMESYLPNLKSSLSLTLQQFYPLAGKIRLSPNSDDQQYVLFYEEGDSVPFTVAESDDDFIDLIGSHPRDYAKLLSFAPRQVDPDAGNTLLAIQVTVFPNHGICVGFELNHIACDGFSFIHFIKSWASACRTSNVVAPPPSFDRSAFASLRGYYSAFLESILHNKINTLGAQPPGPSTLQTDLVIVSFTLGREHIERLKKWVQAEAEKVHTSFHCSTYVVSGAYLWVCLAKLRGLATDDQRAYFSMSVDWRERLRPPASAMYFGNCVYSCIVDVKVGHLVKEDGVMAASEAIGRAIQGVKEGIFKVIEDSMNKFQALGSSHCHMNIAGSPRFGAYETDFGWGRPQKVETLSIKTKAISMSESREEQGGVEFSLVLPKKQMEEFAALFTNGLKLHSI